MLNLKLIYKLKCLKVLNASEMMRSTVITSNKKDGILKYDFKYGSFWRRMKMTTAVERGSVKKTTSNSLDWKV